MLEKLFLLIIYIYTSRLIFPYRDNIGSCALPKGEVNSGQFTAIFQHQTEKEKVM